MRYIRSTRWFHAAVSLWAAATAWPVLSFGQADGWTVRVWQTDEGLPDNRITDIVQASDGFLWVSTLGGLTRFDGVRFEELSTVHITRKPNQHVRAMIQDRRGRFWFSMDLGDAMRVDGADASLFDIRFGSLSVATRSMAEGPDGAIWIARSGAILCLNDDGARMLTEADDLPPGSHVSLALDARGDVWCASGPRVGRLVGHRFHEEFVMDSSALRLAPARAGGLWITTPVRLHRFHPGEEPAKVVDFPVRMAVQSIVEDRRGNVWIGSVSSGLFRWDGQTIAPVDIPRPQVTALAEDREGNLWVGTDGGGLCRLTPRTMGMIGEDDGLPPEGTNSVCEDETGDLWTVLQFGRLARERDGRWSVLEESDGWRNFTATCVAPARGGGIWIGTRNRGLCRWRDGQTEIWNESTGHSLRHVRSMLAMSNGDLLLISDWPNQPMIFRGKQLVEVSVPDEMDPIIALTQDVEGTAWAGTSMGELVRLEDDALVRVASASPDTASYVRTLAATVDGSLWIGYGGLGLGRWNGGRYDRVTEFHGLSGRHVSQMLADDDGRLWMTGNRGLSVASIEDLDRAMSGGTGWIRSLAYGRNEGLINHQPTWQFCPSAWRASDGRLLFTTVRGLLWVRPADIRHEPVAPPVFAAHIRVNGEVVASLDAALCLFPPDPASKVVDTRQPGASIDLAPGFDSLEIRLTAPSFTSPDNVRIRHRMRGFDRQWSESDARRAVVYSRMPPGRYEFEAEACNAAGIWTDPPMRLTFHALPFFWQTLPFRLSAAAGVVALIAGIVALVLRQRHRTRLRAVEQQRAIDLERARIARDMHDDLGGSLTKAGLLSGSLRRHSAAADMAKPLALLDETLGTMTSKMDELVWAVNPVHDSIDGLAGYALRFAQETLVPADIQLAADIPDDLPPISLPAPVRHNLFLAFKEAVINAVKHASASEVAVRLSFAEGELVLAVEDDGVGFDPGAARAGGNGLGNMRARMAAIGGRFEIDTGAGRGTRVRFGVRLKTEAESPS